MTTKKITSYQKMKQRYEQKIQELHNDIVVLVEEKDFSEVHMVKMQWRMKLALEKMIWSESSTEI